MKITLPESIKDITLAQFQKYNSLSKELEDEKIDEKEFLKQKISLFSGIPYSQIEGVLLTDLEDVVCQIDTALNEDSSFQNKFMLDEIEFGFIENLDKITAGEYFDLSKYGTEVDTLHNLMAILFRPIKNKDKYGNYKIKKYKGTEKYAELMRRTPMNIVNGSLVFFCNLSKELRIYIQRFTEIVQEKDMQQLHILKNGVGMQRFMN